MSQAKQEDSILLKNIRKASNMLSKFDDEDTDLHHILQNLKDLNDDPILQFKLPINKGTPRCVLKKNSEIPKIPKNNIKLQDGLSSEADELALPKISPPRSRKVAVKKVPAQVNQLKFAAKLMAVTEEVAPNKIPKIWIKYSTDNNTFQTITNRHHDDVNRNSLSF